MSGTFGGIGRLEIAPFDPPDAPFPTYVDITPYVRAEQTPLTIRRGRQTELDTIQPSQLQCVLDNTDGRFTPGLTTGPYGSGFNLGCKVRYSETIGSRTFVEFTGYVEAPDDDDWQPIGYAEVKLSALDRLTRLGRTPPFPSTLGAHILANGGSALKAYYPLNELGLPVTSVVGAASPLTVVTQQNGVGFNPNNPQLPSITYGGGAPAPGDDLASIVFQPSADSGSPHTAVYSMSLTGTLATPLTLTSGQVVTLVAWVNASDYASSTRFAELDGDGLVLSGVDTGGLPLKAVGGGPGWGGTTVDGGPVRTGTAMPIAARMGFNPATCELWVKSDIYTAVMSTAGPTDTTFRTLTIGNGTFGAVSHVQVYVGAPGDWDRSKFLAQVAVGFGGLEFQTTGQRVNTILDYCGVAAADRLVDPGVTFMAPAKLATQTGAAALQTAVDTERARAFVDGTGRYVFQDRAHVLNV